MRETSALEFIIFFIYYLCIIFHPFDCEFIYAIDVKLTFLIAPKMVQKKDTETYAIHINKILYL